MWGIFEVAIWFGIFYGGWLVTMHWACSSPSEDRQTSGSDIKPIPESRHPTQRNPNTRPWPHRSQSPRTREPPVLSPDPDIIKQQLEQVKAEILAFVGQDFEVAVKTINDMGYDVKVLFAVEPRDDYVVPRCGVAHGPQHYYGVVLYVKQQIVTKIDIPIDPSGLRIWQDDRPCRDDTNSWCKDQPQRINVRPSTKFTEVYK